MLCSVVAEQQQHQGQQPGAAPGPAAWEAAAAALGAGAAATTIAGVDMAAAQGRKRDAQVGA